LQAASDGEPTLPEREWEGRLVELQEQLLQTDEWEQLLPCVQFTVTGVGQMQHVVQMLSRPLGGVA